MNLLPRSLFGRIALILAGGFLAVQAVTTAIAISDRDALVARAGANQAAARIADAARIIVTTSGSERRRIMQVISNDTLKLAHSEPATSGAVVMEQDEELILVARDALEQALPEGMGFKVLNAQLVHLDPDFRLVSRFGERSGVKIFAILLPGDGVSISVQSTIPARTSQWGRRLLRNLAIVDGVMVILCFFAVRLATRPLSVLASAAEDLGRDIDRPPLPERGATELKRAARALNVMQDRLKRYVDTRVKILAAMSHDLKTPITRMRLRTELLEDAQIKAKFARDLDELQQMVVSTLESMRGLSESSEAVAPIDVGVLISDLKENAEEAGRTLTVSGVARAPVMGRAQALKRCLQNLIDNALAYGQRAEINLREEGGVLNIVVSDDGPGIPEGDLEKVFEPFYRVEGSRNRNTGGSGLGLSIARNIAQAHGGSVRLRNLPGRGLEATLVLPRGA